ncbi:hypothetical protein BT69DRAFT_1349956 [Atractiella rhizophila]|nr:hypothetical protein BT69DRAFT_1349956 [Atractiella rhizophila]
MRMGEDTPFRKEERKWKSKHPQPNWADAFQPLDDIAQYENREVDFKGIKGRVSEVEIDLGDVALGQAGEESVKGTAWTFDQFPGLIYLPSLLPPKLQRSLLHLSLSLANPSHTTSLSAQHHLPSAGLFSSSLPPTSTLEPVRGGKGRVERVKGPRVRVDREPATVSSRVGEVVDEGVSVTPQWTKEEEEEETAKPMNVEEARMKIRWSLLGHAYDWNTKSYPPNEEPLPFPAEMKDLSRRIVDALIPSSSYSPDTGIVNYYGLTHSLTAHVDQSEPSGTSHPLLSISLGHACIFLFGKETRDVMPLPILLRSGDVVIMHGEGRRAFHGVPRIIADTPPSWINDVEDEVAMNWVKSGGRININVRQMF